jgi:hypothetical protein
MTPKPKTRKAPAVPATIAEAIARCKAAKAAYNAAPDQKDETLIPLSESESDACIELSKTPCVSDAEFIEKLRYLNAREIWLWGRPKGDTEFGTVVIAVAKHFGGAA